MANYPLQVKVDVINELRNKLYYNQAEISRLLNSPIGLTHREVVEKVAGLLQSNVAAQASIELLEQYLPAQQPSATPAPENDGIKKID